MGTVLSNERLTDGVYHLKVETNSGGAMGQFYMLRAWGAYPILSRPLSIHEVHEDSVEFLYHVVGEGTEIFSRLGSGDSVELEGPFGNGFPQVEGKVALIGGGIGIAPLYYCAKQLPGSDIFLGFSREAYRTEAFRPLASELVVDVGGLILDSVDFSQYDHVFVCGPHPMLKAAQRKGIAAEEAGIRTKVYLSLENRMACGIGACLVCSVSCRDGQKKACADGPVFLSEEVIFHD
ncbi:MULTISPECIES: dihydroorotate dehydrogenase electron transfer subunit [Paenibacillus]|uniref:dihydroorotate dehydrogenase electron transfer subunit n=1 Tax=Paenibacillus TaxID=44249 RepID=UPI00096ECB9E|nr:dihydroorotate dehydrogenase electron transfer subunit [Paenibacillus odorifer]MEC0133945.1 dihydroorotate dehydrogenase electron transfer subunit [Paenibacillus odorifer]MEC0222769.1 dihydroorotate dehydrogenase electron transfer subunit [Paenibacillus odorifer]OMD03394.1 dihydroorotate dehydrogenase electron transfer subunit [Paenibacillus odorifer]OMD27524.1 dihydroorotate dehydrogenase electron transfer subunit [Paenibacillus odorifer]OME41924.1 dihydroorotate dehydrogenase electron tra